MAIERSSERPMERKRQPVKWYMFSCTRPEKPVILRKRTLMARAASSPGVTRSAISRAVLARSFSAIQPSTEKRSRTLPAETMALSSMPISGARDRLRRVEAMGFEVVGQVRDQRCVGVGGLGEADVEGAHEAERALGAFDVAAEPVEVVAGAARQDAGADALVGRGRRGQHGDGLDRAARDHPDVGGGAAALHGDGADVGGVADPGEAAAHDLPALGRAGEEDAQAHRPRDEHAVLPGRGGGEGDHLLTDEPRAVRLEPGVEGLARHGAEPAAEDGGVVGLVGEPGRERGTDHHPVLVGADVGALRGLAAPPGGDVGQDERLAEQRLGDAREEGEERAGLEDAGAERVDEGDGAGAGRADEAGGAEAGGGVELERVGEGGVEAAPEDGDRAEAGDGADHDAAVLDGEILAFEQAEAEVAGDPGVLEVGLVVRAGVRMPGRASGSSERPCSASRKVRKKPARRWTWVSA